MLSNQKLRQAREAATIRLTAFRAIRRKRSVEAPKISPAPLHADRHVLVAEWHARVHHRIDASAFSEGVLHQTQIQASCKRARACTREHHAPNGAPEGGHNPRNELLHIPVSNELLRP